MAFSKIVFVRFSSNLLPPLGAIGTFVTFMSPAFYCPPHLPQHLSSLSCFLSSFTTVAGTPSLGRCKKHQLPPYGGRKIIPPKFNLENQWIHQAYTEHEKKGDLQECGRPHSVSPQHGLPHSCIDGFSSLQLTFQAIYSSTTRPCEMRA